MPTLLIIDDEPNVCYSLRKALQSESLEVVTASLAKEGIEMVERAPPGRHPVGRAPAGHVGPRRIRSDSRNRFSEFR